MAGKPSDYGMYVVDVFHAPVGAGVTGARFCSIAGVAKTNTTNQPFLVANEFICNRLAMMLGLPAPPGVISKTDDGQLLFLNLRFGRKGEMFPPVNPQVVASERPKEVAGIVAFDVWVANSDRHTGNLIYVRSVMPLAMIDHGNALFGADESGSSRLDERRDKPCISPSGCLHEHLRSLDELERWADRIRRLPEEGIEDICFAAADHGGLTRAQADEVFRFIVYRKSRVHEFVLQSRVRFPNVSQWGLT